MSYARIFYLGMCCALNIRNAEFG